MTIEASARELRVLDDGEGLPEGWPDRNDPRGRGLGLPIARMLAERHGWWIEVGASESGGTSAVLHLGNGGLAPLPLDAQDPAARE